MREIELSLPRMNSNPLRETFCSKWLFRSIENKFARGRVVYFKVSCALDKSFLAAMLSPASLRDGNIGQMEATSKT